MNRVESVEGKDRTARPEEGLFWIAFFLIIFVGTLGLTIGLRPKSGEGTLSESTYYAPQNGSSGARSFNQQIKFPRPFNDPPGVNVQQTYQQPVVPSPYPNVRVRPAYRQGPQTIPSMVDERDLRRQEEDRAYSERWMREREFSRQRSQQDDYHRNRYEHLKEQYFSNGASWEERSRLRREMDNELRMMSTFR